MGIFIRIICVSVFLLIAYTDAISDEPARVKVHQKIQDASIAGYEKASCINISPDEKICKCRDDDTGNGYFIHYKSDEELAKWATSCFMGETEGYEVVELDLDNDGDREIVVADRVGATNGMLIFTWIMSILDEPTKNRTPLMFELEDYGPTCFVQDEKQKYILATEWPRVELKKEHNGTIFIARPMRYENGCLQIADKSILTRRLTYRFEDIRNSYKCGYPCTYPIYRWMNNSAARKTNSEPYYLDKIVESIDDGKIVEAEVVQDSIRIGLKVKIEADGKLREYIPTSDWGGGTYWFGDVKTGKLFPMFYIPADYKNVLINRKVNVTRYNSLNTGYCVIWLK